MHTQKEDHIKTKKENGHLLAEERGLRRNQPCVDLDLRFLASRMVTKQISPVQTAQSVVLCYDSLSKLIEANI